jgi:hypothetical protein
MGFQFIHVETYGKKASKVRANNSGGRSLSAAEVIAEAVRADGACPHVEKPQVPTVIYGESPEFSLWRALASFDIEPKTAVKTKDGVKYRGVREDTPIMLAGVCGWPYTPEEMAQEPARVDLYQDWLKRSQSFLVAEYGEALRSVVLHTDESRPHLHFYVSAERAIETKRLHVGATAESKKEACEALRGFQDRYFGAVSVHCGLTRKGPRRRRISRQEWKQEKIDALALAGALAAEKVRGSAKAKLVLETLREHLGGGELPEDFKNRLRSKLGGGGPSLPPAPHH